MPAPPGGLFLRRRHTRHRCPYCHDGVEVGARCPECAALYHQDCAGALSACAVYGCVGRPPGVRPQPIVVRPRPRRRRRRWGRYVILAAVLALLGPQLASSWLTTRKHAPHQPQARREAPSRLSDLSRAELLDLAQRGATLRGYYFCLHRAGRRWVVTANPTIPGTTGDVFLAVDHTGRIARSTAGPIAIGPDARLPPPSR